MKKLALIFFSMLILTGCSAKSAQQHGHGISIEMTDSLNIKHMTLIKYVNGIEAESQNVINADNSSFEKGEIIWFDVSPSNPNSAVEFAISYSKNSNGTNERTTEKINVPNENDWMDIMFTEEYQLKLVDLK